MNAKRQPRHGSLVHEAVMGIALTLAVMAGVAQLVTLVALQRRTTEQRSLAALEAGNVMEQWMARPWAEVTPEQAANAALSEVCRRDLPEARLQVAVEPEGDADAVRRIRVQIDWLDNARHRGEPVRLVAWRHRDEEAQP